MLVTQSSFLACIACLVVARLVRSIRKLSEMSKSLVVCILLSHQNSSYVDFTNGDSLARAEKGGGQPRNTDMLIMTTYGLDLNVTTEQQTNKRHALGRVGLPFF
jgi:hypothetical protein